jgi:murein DD-endopeptidase MepM/ murein hydrolase activator NlpD
MHLTVLRRFTATLAALGIIATTLIGASSARADYAAMIHPASGRISSVVGGCPSDARPTHMGIDIAGPGGAPIVAAFDGVVTTRVVNFGTTGYGNHVIITHASGYTTLYAHMQQAPAVALDQTVTKGQTIGLVGNTGNSFGAHLHFELKRSGANIANQGYACGQTVTRGYAIPMDFPGLQSNTPKTIHETAVHGSSWQKMSTGQQISSRVFTTVNMGTGWGDILSSSGGYLWHSFVNGGRWITLNSGLALNATSMSAVNVGQASPQILAVEDGRLMHVWGNSNGWQKGWTGIHTTGKVSAVLMADNSIQAMINQGGTLYQVWTGGGAWRIASTGRPVGDAFEAVYMGGSAPQVMTVLNGQLHQIWATSTEWVAMSTGIAIAPGATLSAVNMGGGWPQVFTAEAGYLYQTAVMSGGWTRMATGTQASGPIDAVSLGGGQQPRVYTAD